MSATKPLIVAATAVVVLAAVVYAAELSGRWELHADFDDRSIPGAIGNCTLKQEAERLTGRCENVTLAGEVKGDTVSWRVTLLANHDVMTFTGKLDDDDTVVVGRFSYPGKGDGSFLAIKR